MTKVVGLKSGYDTRSIKVKELSVSLNS